jgi:predicted dehydrogenase
MSQLLKVAVVDVANARGIAQKHGTEAFPDDSDVIPLVDAVSLIVPTRRYYKIAGEFLEAGIHCLVEKVFADTTQADLSITETTTNRCPPLAMVSELPESQLEVVREAMLVA